MTRGAWNLVKSYTGSTYVDSPYFYIPGSEVRLNYTNTGDPTFALFSFYLYQQGQSAYTYALTSIPNVTGTTYAHNIASGQYYLKVGAANLKSWAITIEVWVPA